MREKYAPMGFLTCSGNPTQIDKTDVSELLLEEIAAIVLWSQLSDGQGLQA